MSCHDRNRSQVKPCTENCCVVSSNTEIHTNKERLVHMSRYLDFLAVEQEFKAITDADKPLDKGAVLTLFSKIEPATDYLNAVSEEHGVKNVVAPCSIADIEGSENVPLIIAYMTIKIEAMKAAFHELAWAIDDLNLPQALEELNTVVESFTEA